MDDKKRSQLEQKFQLDKIHWGDKEIDRIWQLRLHQDVMFNNRSNFFLVFESLLIGFMGVLINAKNQESINIFLFRAIITDLGFFISLIWMYAQIQHGFLLNTPKKAES